MIPAAKSYAMPEERYRRDALFRAIVDMLEGHLHACTLTPTELREAVMLAATHHQYRSCPSFAYVGGALAPRRRGEPIDPHPPVVIVDGVPYRREGPP